MSSITYHLGSKAESENRPVFFFFILLEFQMNDQGNNLFLRQTSLAYWWHMHKEIINLMTDFMEQSLKQNLVWKLFLPCTCTCITIVCKMLYVSRISVVHVHVRSLVGFKLQLLNYQYPVEKNCNVHIIQKCSSFDQISTYMYIFPAVSYNLVVFSSLSYQ